MADLDWLNGYSGQTTAELLSLEGRFRTDSIVLAFEQAIAKKAMRSGPDGLTPVERTVLAVEALEREVNGDGYIGFFTNTPQYAADVVPSLEAIGRPDVAELTRRAIDALDVAGDVAAQSVLAAVEEVDDDRVDHLNACDSRYYESAGDLADPLLAYIRSNADLITIP
jgi:hypothetical protein